MKMDYGNFETSEDVESYINNPFRWDATMCAIVRGRTNEYSFDLSIFFISKKFEISYCVQHLSDNRMTLSLYPLTDKNRLFEFYEIDETFSPASCLVDTQEALQIFREFCNDPTQPPPSANWLDSNEIPWPSAWETREELAARGVKTLFTHLL